MKIAAAITGATLGFLAMLIGIAVIFWPAALIVGGITVMGVCSLVVSVKPPPSDEDVRMQP